MKCKRIISLLLSLILTIRIVPVQVFAAPTDASTDQLSIDSQLELTNSLGELEGVTGYQAVTLDNDPSGLLDKEGGFTDCVYFTVKEISVSSVSGKTIVEKGTDVGGAVEVYASKEDALARCDYLASFDGTILYSGSYAVVGTMVVRTSYKLTNQQQIDLTSAITSAMLTLNQS